MHEQLTLMQILSDRLNFKMFLVSIHARFICGVRFFVSMMDPFPEKKSLQSFFCISPRFKIRPERKPDLEATFEFPAEVG